MSLNPLLASAAIGTAALLIVGCSAPSTVSTEPLRDHPAVSLYEGYHADYIAFETPAELAEFAELAIAGEIASVDAGRTWGFVDDDLPDTQSVVVAVQNPRVVGGADAEMTPAVVYVELQNFAGVPLSEFQDALPTGAPVAFYLSAGAERGDAPDLQDPEAGRPIGEPIYVPVGPQGFAVELAAEGVVAWPMATQVEAGEISDALPGGAMLPG